MTAVIFFLSPALEIALKIYSLVFMWVSQLQRVQQRDLYTERERKCV